MVTRPRACLGVGLTILGLATGPVAFGQDASGQASPQSVPSAPFGMPNGQAAPGGAQSGTAYGDIESGAPGQQGGGMTGAPSSAAGAGAATAPGAGAAGAAGAFGATAADLGAAPSLGLGGGAGGGGSYFGMIGDAAPQSRLNIFARPGGIPKPPPLPNPGVPPGPPRFPAVGTTVTAAVLPAVQQLKISENQSPAPQDRIYTTFNYFNNVNYARNNSLGAGINQIQIYRYVAGFEKTFLDGRASAGLRLPIDNLSSTSRFPGYGGTSTAVGDLAAIFKYAFWVNRDTGSLASAGLMLSFPTGPNRFAGARGFNAFRDTSFTPYLGFVINRDALYFQGFSSLEIPTDQNQATVLYNDLGVGYFVYRATEPDRFISGFAPTFELHVNTPLSHRGFGGPGNVLNGLYDVVDLTLGGNILLGRRGVLTLGVVDPVTGPRPFSLEAIAQFNIRF